MPFDREALSIVHGIDSCSPMIQLNLSLQVLCVNEASTTASVQIQS
jgi:hypothetical protein